MKVNTLANSWQASKKQGLIMANMRERERERERERGRDRERYESLR